MPWAIFLAYSFSFLCTFTKGIYVICIPPWLQYIIVIMVCRFISIHASLWLRTLLVHHSALSAITVNSFTTLCHYSLVRLCTTLQCACALLCSAVVHYYAVRFLHYTVVCLCKTLQCASALRTKFFKICFGQIFGLLNFFMGDIARSLKHNVTGLGLLLK